MWGLADPRRGPTRTHGVAPQAEDAQSPRGQHQAGSRHGWLHLQPRSREQVRDWLCRWAGGTNLLPQLCRTEAEGLTGQEGTTLGCPAVPVSHLWWAVMFLLGRGSTA